MKSTRDLFDVVSEPPEHIQELSSRCRILLEVRYQPEFMGVKFVAEPHALTAVFQDMVVCSPHTFRTN